MKIYTLTLSFRYWDIIEFIVSGQWRSIHLKERTGLLERLNILTFFIINNVSLLYKKLFYCFEIEIIEIQSHQDLVKAQDK